MIPEVKAVSHKQNTGGLASNILYLVWATFGGFMLHILLCNFLSVLLRPSYEKPVDTTRDLLDRKITPFLVPGSEFIVQFFENSLDPNLQELSKRMYIAKTRKEHDELTLKVISTGLYADIGSRPDYWLVPKENHKDWYRSSETITLGSRFGGSLTNKKWPLQKVKSILLKM